MYYKVIGQGKILDVIIDPQYVTYQSRNNIIVLSTKENANGIISTDGSTVWHVIGWDDIPLPDILSVQFIEIDESEYRILKSAIESEEAIEADVATDNETTITLEYVKEKAIKKMRAECEEAIVGGVDVMLSDGLSHHFDLTIEDQINLISLKEMIAAGATEIPYHESDCLCKMYSPEDIIALLNAASAHKMYHTTYFNSLKGYINCLKEIEAVNNVYYGMIIPEEHWSEVLIAIAGGEEM